MQVVTAARRSPSVPARPLLRLAAAAVAAALLVAAAGWALQGALLGVTEEAARARVERDVRRTFDVMAQQLRTGTGVLADPALVTRAAGEDEEAAARLFARAREAVAAER